MSSRGDIIAGVHDVLELFSAPTQAWFRHAFATPTAAQSQAWPLIHAGGDVLVTAPTGSGKTLCAFLAAIDRLMAMDPALESDEGRHDGGPAGKATRSRTHDGVKVLYISPLKALAVDVAKNLEAPLAGITAACEAQGVAAPDVRVAIRSGDTTPKERRAIAAHPPDILVTTPESLFLLLTSKARRILGTVDTVIVDEVHALAGTKRGAHLTLSMERLDLLRAASGNGRPVQRIGLSATVNPPSEAARFLGGGRPVAIVDPGERPAMDLRVVEPLADMRDLQSSNVKGRAGGVDGVSAGTPAISGVTPAMRRLAERKGLAGGDGIPARADSSVIVGAAGDGTVADGNAGSIWPVVECSVLDEVLAHRTTLVFVNSRGLAEKLTARLNDLYAERCGTGRHGDGRDAGRRAGGDKGSPEGREGFARHYDAVVGGTSQLVSSHGDGDAIAMAHHGSVSKDRRKQIEERLKHGQLRCVVATSSLELGIDMGSVDLVIQISPPLSVASGLQRVGRADHRVGGVSHALLYPLTREQIVGVAASVESMRAGAIEPLAVPRNPLDVLAQQTVAAAAMDVLKPGEWYAAVRRAAPFAELGRDMFDAVLGMLTGAYADEEFSAFRPPLSWDREADLVTARPGAQRLAVTSGGTIPDRGLYAVVLPEADAGRGPRRVGELDEEMVYESRVGDVITLGTSTWQIQEITRDRVVVTPAPGRTARLPFWHGEGFGRDAGFGRSLGRFLREIADGLETDGVSSSRNAIASRRPERSAVSSGRPDRDNLSSRRPDRDVSRPCRPERSAVSSYRSEWDVSHSCRPERSAVSSCRPERSAVSSGRPEWDVSRPCRPERSAAESKDLTAPHFTAPIEHRLRGDGLDGNAIANLARLLAEQRAATGVVPSERDLVIERCRDEDGDWRIMLHSPYGRRVHEPWAMAVGARLRQRYGFDGHACASDDGIVIGIPEGEGHVDAADLFRFDPDDMRRIIEEQVGQSVLFASRFRECAARSLYMPRTEPGRRVPLWQQRLRAAQLLAAARTKRNFPLLLETARECLQDVYDMPALRRVMAGLDSGTVTLREVETPTPSPFAENLLFGFVGQMMYQYDVPQAERNAQLLAMDPEVLERLLGKTDMAAVLDPAAVAEVERQLAARTFWNELAADDVPGRVARYAKTHGPFTADRMIADLGVPAEAAVRALDDLKARGEVLRGRFAVDADAPDGDGSGGGRSGTASGVGQWLHKEVFARIRALSLAKARKAIRPVEAAAYQSFLLDWQGVGAGKERVGADGLLEVIAQLEGVTLPARVWEHEVFPIRVKDYVPAMLDGLLSSGDVVWVGSVGQRIAFHPAGSPLLGASDLLARRPERGVASSRCPEQGTAPSRRSDGSNFLSRLPEESVSPSHCPERSAEGAESKDLLQSKSPLASIILAILSDGGAHRIDQLGMRTRERLQASYVVADDIVADASTGEVLDGVRPEHVSWSEETFERTLWELVWRGLVTNSSFTPVRAKERGAIRRAPSAPRSRMRLPRHSRMRMMTPPSLAGLWSLVAASTRDDGGESADGAAAADDATVSEGREPEGHGPEQAALAQVETLLDRYGVVAQPLVEQEGVAGGFSVLYPLLRRMEEHGKLVRGMFVKGFGAAQFAERSTVDALRRYAAHDEGGGTGPNGEGPDGHSPSSACVTLGALDPANLAGAAVPWPAVPAGAAKPARRDGNLVVLAHGMPVVFAAVRGHRLVVFPKSAASSGRQCDARQSDADIAEAFAALADALRRMGIASAAFSDVNGEPLTVRNPYAAPLRQAGFVPTPQGMRLY